MHRDGHDPENIQPEDILCDFCARPTWAMDVPSIEGHHGSILCSDCLDQAWGVLVGDGGGLTGDDTWKCTMCLETRDPPWWESPTRAEARVCRRCVKQAAGALHKNRDWDWQKPPSD
mgnify:CR=1 FL=1